MDYPRFYHYAKVSGLVSTEVLDEVLDDLRSRSTSAPEEPIYGLASDAAKLRHVPHLKGSGHHEENNGASDENDISQTDSDDASLDGELDRTAKQRITKEDRRLADELIRRGCLNAWQSIQLLDGRTKFTLGNYWIFDSIGRGGYGHVFLGREDRTARKNREGSSKGFFAIEQLFALKVLPHAKATPTLIARFLHEIEIQKNLDHPNLVRFIDSGQDGNVHYMVHEFADGGDMRRLLRAEKSLPIDIAAAICSHLASGIHYLHENGIVHRDVKPANVLLSSEGVAKLTDLGLSVPSCLNLAASENAGTEESSVMEREIDKLSGSTIGKVAGTVDYMAPDQIRRPSEPTPAWDIYSLGCTLYQALTGSVPFPKGDSRQKFRAHVLTEPTDPRILNPTIPFDLVDLLRQMLVKDPKKRISTAREVADRLALWIPPYGLSEQLDFQDIEIKESEPGLGFPRPIRLTQDTIISIPR